MHCPFCGTEDTRVVDSRLVADGSQIRRRRECANCKERFTTFEVAELLMPRVVKRDGSREPFDEHKLRAGLQRALEKRPVSVEAVEAAIGAIKRDLQSAGSARCPPGRSAKRSWSNCGASTTSPSCASRRSTAASRI